jgi:glutathione synthase/RimK-type ligase-like ATP-grasp enzyme
MEGAVLIISTAMDTATDAVVEELTRRNVPVVRSDSEKYPFGSTLTYRIGNHEEQTLALGDQREFRSIWYRRVRPPAHPEGMDAGHFAFSEKESRYALIGSVLALSHVLPTMSNPESVWAAEHKPYQLAIAKQCGLSIPDTLISNLPLEAESFFQRHSSGVVAKPVRTGYLEDADGPKAIYTSKIEESHMRHITRLSVAPATFQTLIHKQSDIRVTIVGEKVFCAEILSQTDDDASVDWRRTSNPNLPHKHHDLLGTVELRLLQYMKRLNLEYGAIDLVLDEEGNYYFLEINPGGQWLWLDRILDLGITECIADWLETGGRA